MTGPEGAIELFHGYTYSSRSDGLRAGIAPSLEIYEAEGIFSA